MSGNFVTNDAGEVLRMPIPRTTKCRRSCSINCACDGPLATQHHPLGSAMGLAPRTDETARAQNMIKTHKAGLLSNPPRK